MHNTQAILKSSVQTVLKQSICYKETNFSVTQFGGGDKSVQAAAGALEC